MSSRILESLLLRRYGDSITDTKQARKVVLEARNNLQTNSSIIWSKELELECIRLAGISSMRKRKGDSVKSSNPGSTYDISSRKTRIESDQEEGSILPFSTIEVPNTSDLVLEMEDISQSECDDVSERDDVVVAEKQLTSVNIQQSSRSKFRAQGRSNSFISEKHSANSKSPSRAETSNSCNTKKLNKSPLVTNSLSDEDDGVHLPISRSNHSRIKPLKDIPASKSHDEVTEKSQKAILGGSNHTTKSRRSKSSPTKSPKTIKRKVVEGMKPINPPSQISESKSPSRRQSASRTTKSIAKSTLPSTVQDLINQRGENLANVRIISRKKRNIDGDTERPQTSLTDVSTDKQTHGINSAIRRNTASSESSNVTRSPSSGEYGVIKSDDDAFVSYASRGKSTLGSNRLSRRVLNVSKNSEADVQRNSLSSLQSTESNDAVLNDAVSVPLSSERSSFMDDDLQRNIPCVHNNGSEVKPPTQKSSGRRLMNQQQSKLRHIYRSPTRGTSKPILNCIPTEIMFDIDRKEEIYASSDDLLSPSPNLQTPSISSYTVDIKKKDENNDKKPLSSCIRNKSSTCCNSFTDEKTTAKPILRPAKIRTNKDSAAKDSLECVLDAHEGTDVTIATNYLQPPPRKFFPVSVHESSSSIRRLVESPELIDLSKPGMDCEMQDNTSLTSSKMLKIGADGFVNSTEAGMRHPNIEIILPMREKPNYDVSISTPRTVPRSLRNKFEPTQNIQEPVSISISKHTKRQLQKEVEDKTSNPENELKQSRYSKNLGTKRSCSPSKRHSTNNQCAANDLDLQANSKATNTPNIPESDISTEDENILTPPRHDTVKNTLQQFHQIDNEIAGSISGSTPVAAEKRVKSTSLLVRTFRQSSERTLLKNPADQNSIVVKDANLADKFDEVVGKSVGKRDVAIGCHPVKTRSKMDSLIRSSSFKVDSAADGEKESKNRLRRSEEGRKLSIDYCIEIQTPSRMKRPPGKKKHLNDKVPVHESNVAESMKGQSEPDNHVEVKEYYYKPSSRRTSSFQRSHSENKLVSTAPPSEIFKAKSKSLVLESLDESQGEVHLNDHDENATKSFSISKTSKKRSVNFPHSISVDDPRRIREVVYSEKSTSIQRNMKPQHDTIYESTTFSSDDDNQHQFSFSSMEKSWKSESESEQSLQTDFDTESNDSSAGSKVDKTSYTDSGDESSRRVASTLSRPSPGRFVDNETSGSTTSSTFHTWKLRCTTAETTSDIVRCTTQNKLLSQKKPRSNRYGKDYTVSSKTQKQQPIADDDDDFDCASMTSADFDNNDFTMEVGDGFHLVDVQNSSFANLSIDPTSNDEKQRSLKPFGTASDRSVTKTNKEKPNAEQKKSYSGSNDNNNNNEQLSDVLDDEKSQKSIRSKRLVMVPVNAIRKEDLSKFLESRSTRTTRTTGTTKSRPIGGIETKKLKAKTMSNIVVPGKVEKEQLHIASATGSTAVSIIDSQNKDTEESKGLNSCSNQDQHSIVSAGTSIEALSLSQSTLSLSRSLHKTTSSGFWDIETYMDSDDSEDSS